MPSQPPASSDFTVPAAAAPAAVPAPVLSRDAEYPPGVSLASRGQQWLVENQAALDGWNAYVAVHGLPLGRYRNS